MNGIQKIPWYLALVIVFIWVLFGAKDVKNNWTKTSHTSTSEVVKTKVVEVQRIIAPVGCFSEPLIIPPGSRFDFDTGNNPVVVRKNGDTEIKLDWNMDIRLGNDTRSVEFKSVNQLPVKVNVKIW